MEVKDLLNKFDSGEWKLYFLRVYNIKLFSGIPPGWAKQMLRETIVITNS
jgi:hypothetical protein